MKLHEEWYLKQWITAEWNGHNWWTDVKNDDFNCCVLRLSHAEMKDNWWWFERVASQLTIMLTCYDMPTKYNCFWLVHANQYKNEQILEKLMNELPKFQHWWMADEMNVMNDTTCTLMLSWLWLKIITNNMMIRIENNTYL